MKNIHSLTHSLRMSRNIWQKWEKMWQIAIIPRMWGKAIKMISRKLFWQYSIYSNGVCWLVGWSHNMQWHLIKQPWANRAQAENHMDRNWRQWQWWRRLVCLRKAMITNTNAHTKMHDNLPSRKPYICKTIFSAALLWNYTIVASRLRCAFSAI